MQQAHQGIWKVGLFVVIGVVLLVGIAFALQDWWATRGGYTLYVRFESASGLSAGAPVQYAGVEVGEVQSITIMPENSAVPQDGEGVNPRAHVRLRLWISEEVRVRADDQVFIGMLGLLGEKFVAIRPASGEGRVLRPGETMVGSGAISELELARQVSRILAQTEGTLADARGLLEGSSLPERLSSSLARAEKAAEQLDRTTERAEALMNQIHRWAPFVAVGMVLLPVIAGLLVD